jgi:NAD(P)-dependent dehydrogenase (short-subunit alcohol dehydrogenase family)
MTRLKDQTTALVTGSTSGIGTAIAHRLANRNAHVLISGRDHGRGDAVVDSIRAAGGHADFIQSNLDGVAGARELAATAVGLAGGPIDVLVNNAATGAVAPTPGFPEEAFDAVMTTNLKVPFYLVSELAPAMAAQGRGAIVNVSSIAGSLALPGMAVYGASKAALMLLTKSWAAEFGPHGVRVNAVIVGPTRTPGSAELGDALEQLASQAPAGRVALADEIASAVDYLVSESAGFIHGAALPVDGGRTAV